MQTSNFKFPPEFREKARMGKKRDAFNAVLPEFREYFREQGINPGTSQRETAQAIVDHFEGAPAEGIEEGGGKFDWGEALAFVVSTANQVINEPDENGKYTGNTEGGGYEPQQAGFSGMSTTSLVLIALGIVAAIYFITKK